MTQEKSQIPTTQNPNSKKVEKLDLETFLFGLELPAMPTLTPVTTEAGATKVVIKREMVEKLVEKMKEL